MENLKSRSGFKAEESGTGTRLFWPSNRSYQVSHPRASLVNTPTADTHTHTHTHTHTRAHIIHAVRKRKIENESPRTCSTRVSIEIHWVGSIFVVYDSIHFAIRFLCLRTRDGLEWPSFQRCRRFHFHVGGEDLMPADRVSAPISVNLDLRDHRWFQEHTVRLAQNLIEKEMARSRSRLVCDSRFELAFQSSTMDRNRLRRNRFGRLVPGLRRVARINSMQKCTQLLCMSVSLQSKARNSNALRA